MYTDVVDLRDFYETTLGQVATRMLRRRIRLIWPSVDRMSVVGLGYAAPYLRPFLGEAERVISLMPASQGVLPWPKDGPNITALTQETELPFQDASIDRILLVHALECSEPPWPMLNEIWRVLASGGRLLVVVPNRRGIWAQLDRTPFGIGRPYTGGQLSKLLREAAFTPVETHYALYAPPTKSRVILAAANAWESAGGRWFNRFAGVLVMEASKQVYAKPKMVQAPQRRVVYRPAVTPALRSVGQGFTLFPRPYLTSCY